MKGTISSAKRARRKARRPRDDDQEEDEKIGNDDLLVEILSRVPYKSLIRFKCVSRRWRHVISHPDHRRRLPRYHLNNTIAGFFHYTDRDLQFYYLPGREPPPLINPSFCFLPKCERLHLLDSCNGLFLVRCLKLTDPKEFNYVVCNPATKKWAALPDSTRCLIRPSLVFDPAVSSHFHLFELVEDELVEDWVDDAGYGHVVGLMIYSSKTGVWSDKIDSGWGIKIKIQDVPKSVFFNGMLHVLAMESSVVAVVDVEGQNWRTIPLPHKEGSPLYGAQPLYSYTEKGSIDLSQGLLCFVSTDKYDAHKLSVWVLDDYCSDQWTLHHTVISTDLFGKMHPDLGHDYTLVSIQEHKMFFIFYDRDLHDHKIMSYGMDSGEVCFLHSLGRYCQQPYVPYLPLLLESLADGP